MNMSQSPNRILEEEAEVSYHNAVAAAANAVHQTSVRGFLEDAAKLNLDFAAVVRTLEAYDSAIALKQSFMSLR